MNASAPTSKSKVRRRNPLALNPLMKKSHVHDKDQKTRRAKLKQDLQKKLKDQLERD